MLLGVQVNPNGPACPRFTAKNLTPPLSPQKPLTTYDFPSSQILRNETLNVSLTDLKRRLDEAEVKLRRIKDMLKA